MPSLSRPALTWVLVLAQFFFGLPIPSPVFSEQVQAPKEPAKPAVAAKVKVPRVLGLTWKSAVSALHAAGFKAEGEDAGHDDATVISQSPAAGSDADKGEIVFVRTMAPKPEAPVLKAAGGRTLLDVTDLAPGKYLLDKPADGSDPTVDTARIIVPVAPGPGPAPVPSTLTERGKAVKAAADKAIADPKRDETAVGIAKVYRTLADAAEKDPTITPKSLANAVSSGTDLIVSRQGQSAAAAAAWKPVRDVVSGDTYGTGKLQEDGAPLAEYVKLYREAADGLDASVVKKSIDPDFWKWLIETILPILLQLLLKKAAIVTSLAWGLC